MNQVQPVPCPDCGAGLPWTLFNTEAAGRCFVCNSEVFGFAFPVLIKGITPGKAGERLVSDEEASCFYHGQKKAAVACDHCGRFLCALCDVDFGGKHLCPMCIEMGHGKNKMKNLENRRVLYDDVALSIAILPMIIFYFTFITAPISLFVAIRHWNSPSSIIPRTRFRAVLAMVISTLQIIGWGVLVYIIVRK